MLTVYKDLKGAIVYGVSKRRHLFTPFMTLALVSALVAHLMGLWFFRIMPYPTDNILPQTVSYVSVDPGVNREHEIEIAATISSDHVIPEKIYEGFLHKHRLPPLPELMKQES